MIVSAATFSLSQARECLNRWPERHPFATMNRAWVGFYTDAGDASPLGPALVGVDGPACVVRMADVDLEGWRMHREQFGASTCDLAPTIEHARRIVRGVLALHAAPVEYALAVHCHKGLWRSGSVVEWVRTDLGVPESSESERIVECGNDSRTYNATLLRLLREAHAEMSAGAKVTR